MKQSNSNELYPAGRQVKMHAGWNHDSNSLVGQVGTVVDWRPPFSFFEKNVRNKVVFSDGSYVICDRDFLRPLLRDVVADKLVGIRRAAECSFRIFRTLQTRFLYRKGN